MVELERWQDLALSVRPACRVLNCRRKVCSRKSPAHFPVWKRVNFKVCSNCSCNLERLRTLKLLCSIRSPGNKNLQDCLRTLRELYGKRWPVSPRNRLRQEWTTPCC